MLEVVVEVDCVGESMCKVEVFDKYCTKLVELMLNAVRNVDKAVFMILEE